MRLTLEILKKLNDFDYVLGIMGDYTGSNPSMGPMHDIGDFQKRRQEVDCFLKKPIPMPDLIKKVKSKLGLL